MKKECEHIGCKNEAIESKIYCKIHMMKCERCNAEVEYLYTNYNDIKPNGKIYHLCKDCIEKSRTPLSMFVERLKAIDNPHSKEAKQVIQDYRVENDCYVHVVLLQIIADKTRYYPKYI